MFASAASQTSAGDLSALFCGQFAGGNCRGSELLGRDSEVASVPCFGEVKGHEGAEQRKAGACSGDSRDMKPCRRNRKKIALLTLAALDPGEGRKLRSHLEICPGCAEYLQQLVNVGERVRTAKMETDIETSAAYHREIVAALRAQAATREALTVVLQRWLLRWRVGVPVGIALLLAAA